MIAHNAVAFFHDGISVCTHGVPDPERDRLGRGDRHLQQRHPRDRRRLHRGGRRRAQHPRDAEPRNERGAHGLSAQPIFGGPAYYIRNVVYNTPVALKFINPAGVIVYHNTFVAENRTDQQVSNAHFANNLFLGTDTTTGDRIVGRTDGVLDVRLRRLPAESRRRVPVFLVGTP